MFNELSNIFLLGFVVMSPIMAIFTILIYKSKVGLYSNYFIESSLYILIVTWILNLIILFQFFLFSKNTVLFLNGVEISLDSISFFLQAITVFFILSIGFTFLVLQISIKIEYIYLLLVMPIFVVYIFLTNDIISLILSIEGISFILYCYAAVPNSKLKGVINYIIVSLISSSLLIFGLSIIYFVTGIFRLNDLNIFFKYFFTNNNDFLYGTLLLGSIFIIIGIIFKLSMAPLHSPLVELYDDSTIIVVQFFSIFSKLIFLFVLVLKLKFVLFFIPVKFIIFFFSILSILVGTIGAFSQLKITTLLAYSSVTNIGYTMLAVVFDNYAIAVVYLIIYSLINFVLFFILFSFNIEYRGFNVLLNITDYRGYYFISPHQSINLSLVLFALIGLPPFVSFFSKLMILNLVVSAGFYTLSLVLVFFSVLGSFYYVRIIRDLFFYGTDCYKINWLNNSKLSIFVMYLLNGLVCFLVFVIPNLLIFLNL
jgi:NADH-quinone oxidoreductase subunit N